MPQSDLSAPVVAVPCLKDNFAFLLHDRTGGATLVVDVPEAGPVVAALAARGWQASHVLLTHHHGDHVQGLAELLAALPRRPEVVGAAADAHRLPPLDRGVVPGERLTLGGLAVAVIDVAGHTLGHVAYHLPAAAAAFTGDSLMAMGCGRLFEGTAPMMWDSLCRLDALPADTRICAGHDYLAGNAAFAASIEPGNPAIAARLAAARAAGPQGVHATLAEERRSNPFLRARLPAVKAALGMPGASDAETFAELRRRKDRF